MKAENTGNIFRKKALLLKERPPAKQLDDIELREDVYKADFQIGEKYSSYSSEIIRLSLVGIGGYGFLISDILMKSKNAIQITDFVFAVFVIGIASLGFALALSLFHRFNLTKCLFDQILISRSLLRLSHSHWTDEEKEREKDFLAIVRECQRTDGKRFQKILFWSGLFLFIGFFSVVVLFFSILSSIFH